MKRSAALAGLVLIAATAATAILASGGGTIADAKPGAHIVWPSGDGQTLSIVGKRFDPAITVDASKATFSAIVIRDSSGVHIKGGTVIGSGGRSYGINIQGASHVSIEGMTITGAHRGIVAGGSEDIILKNNMLTGLASDGINIPLSRRVLIEGNTCENFKPRPAEYDANGKMLKDGDHPDCIQAWSRPKAPPVADIKIINNRIDGKMHGIFLGNHIRNGVDDGGFDRIVIEGNTIRVASWHGISVGSTRGLVVRNNRVSTVPNSFSANVPPKRITAWIRITQSTDVVACGNTVEKARNSMGLETCRQPAEKRILN